MILPLINNGQSINIKVKDNSNQPLISATIQLISVADSSVKIFGTTDKSGLAEINKVKDGLYIIKISYIGFQTIEKTISVKEGSRSYNYTLKEKSLSLNEVTISAEKPIIRQEEDKMIIDPKPLVGISTNTLEVLENTPGLFVDYESGIYLSSTSPAVIFVNGREQKLSTQDMINLLRNLPPGSIEKIEVMRTPSTKYDAASSGGIINVILKKGIKIGRFGNINAGMNQGIYGNRFIGFSLNNGGERTSYYINVNYNSNALQEDLKIARTLGNDTTLFQNAISKQRDYQGYLGYGLSYELTKKSNFSYDGRISYSDRNSTSINNSFIDGKQYLHLLESENQIDNYFTFWSISQDFGLNYKIDTIGSELDTKLSFNITNNNADQEYNSVYTLPISMLIQGSGNNLQQRQFLLFQSDLTYTLPFKLKLETGIKSSWQDYNSEANYFTFENGTNIPDSSRTNSFNYREGINAAYLQLSRTIWADILVKTGCRLEHTYMNGKQTIPSDTSFLINRADLFPYVYLSRRLLKIFGIELKTFIIYRRTITRPDYQNLNPYMKYIDPFLYEAGNPDLKPQFTDNVEVNISYEEWPVLAIGQNYTTDIFSSVVYHDNNQSSVAVMTYDNLGKNKETYFRGMAGIPPGGAYFFAVGAQYNLNNYDGFYEGRPFSYERGSWRLFTFHSLKLFKETKLTVSGFMMINGQRGFYELNNFGSLNFGITQNLLNKRLTISLSGRDILRTMLTEFQLNQQGLSTTGDRYFDNRRFGINIRYNFGIGKKENRKGLNNFDVEGGVSM